METEVEAVLDSKVHNEEVNNGEDVSGSTSLAGSSGSNNSDTLNSVSSYHDGEEEEEENDGEDVSDYGDNDDYIFQNDDDNYLRLQEEFDKIKLPPGEEASVSWLMYLWASTSFPSVSLSAEEKALVDNKNNAASEGNEEKALVIYRFEQFKRFDLVEDFSDHYYRQRGFNGQQPTKNWTKSVQDEWKILEENLPDTIYVRACETRMDLMRAVITGAEGTPYHDGLYTFDVLFPPTYPEIPPMVYYYAGGLRLNPNLYDCGKVCLSLLGTWSGKGKEKWIPKESTMLQVLVSIQALILNMTPFYNEPGHDLEYRGAEGERKSKEYNEEVFILSLKTMMYTLRRPPKHFEDLVAGHFHLRADAILSACKAYMEGAQVGSAANVSDPGDGNSVSKEFKEALSGMVNDLVTNFSRYASVDCDQFRVVVALREGHTIEG